MANLPESMFVEPRRGGPSSSRGGARPLPPNLQSASVDQLIVLLREPQHREHALFLLNKKRETSEDLALPLWNSFNTIFILLEEIIATYKLLTPSKLTSQNATRVCNALALLQCVASHPETRMSFIKAKIPVYLYPFLNTTETERPFEFLRLTSLGVIGSLVKADDPQVIHFLLETEIFPLCLLCMDLGCELSKTVATFTVSKILIQDEGLKYCCGFAERFFAVVTVFDRMVEKLVERPSPRLLKHIIRCYLRLSEMPRACIALKDCLPARLRDGTFVNVISEDPNTVRNLQQLCRNIARIH